MQITRRDFLKDMAFTAAVVGLPKWVGDLDEPPPMEMMALVPSAYPWQWTPPSDLGQGNPIITTLNRIAFGPRPGDFERVQSMGIDAYIEEQLAPERIDDSALDQKIAQMYPTLAKSNAELIRDYPQPGPISPQQRAYRAYRVGEEGLKPELPPGPNEVVSALEEATLMRAIYSKRQLNEMLADFWSNHFSIYQPKNDCRWMKTTDDRDVIRKNAFGKFGDLLLASAQSPAMLEYLDNRLNVKGVANENYAREIMELHSLGVDGGYTQKDVAELARAFTGWGIQPPKRRSQYTIDYDGSGVFLFNPKQHDDAPKRILGIDLPAGGGINDALKIIDALAHHPSTARFVSRRLVTRFVSDTPSDALVQSAAQTFTKSNGDIRAVLSVILHSDEFKNSFAQKIKRPYELIASALRATDAQLDDTRALAFVLRAMGQGLFMHLTPDGYPDSGSAWINTGSLLARWNYSLLLGANKVPRGTVNLQAAMKNSNAKTVGDVVDFWINYLLHRTIPDKDRQKLIDSTTLGGMVAFNPALLPQLVALILASPHFQYR